MKYVFLVVLVCAAACASKQEATDYGYRPAKDVVNSEGKMTGVNLEMPNKEIDTTDMDSINDMNAEWVSLVPYGFTARGDAKVQYGSGYQWWGETEEGTISIATSAHAVGQKVMIKPHVWVVGDGWPGDFDLDNEEDWKIWEDSYRKYILTFAKVADSVDAELFCIGTEYRSPAKKREAFWRQLIKEVKEIYDGPLTYAANWDNYEFVKFWDDLDYIGIDGYFPVSKEQQPSFEIIKTGWDGVTQNLKKYSEKWDRKIIFTEYGFKSSEYNVSGMQDDKTKVANMENQFNGYRAFFETIWKEDFFAGGFLWKWTFFPSEKNSGPKNARYTPQGKPAFGLIRDVYGAK
ncbi:hypothetical protein N9355_05255 [Crocinitomicaceae bacterium]|nr:hypothetical protein [Crocinitomicaceae bacterium]